MKIYFSFNEIQSNMGDSLEVSINERVNSQLYSDVINSYVDINAITSTRNIVPGSVKETVVQCTDQTLATLNSAGGQTLFTRFKLTPQVRNSTLAQLAQIYFQFLIPKNSLGLKFKKYTNASSNEDADDTSDPTVNVSEHLKFKLFYDTGFSIASMVQLCLVADVKISTENFNYQQSLLTLDSLPDFTTDNSSSESTLRALVCNEGFRGVGSGIVDLEINYNNTTANTEGKPDFHGTQNTFFIGQDICIEGVADLDKSNPIFHNFPIITRNMSELYIRLYMENFLRELKIVYLNKSRNVGPINITSSELDLTGSKLTTTGAWPTTGTIEATLSNAANNKIANKLTVNGTVKGPTEYLPYQRLPADKADFIFLDGDLYKVRLVKIWGQTPGDAKFSSFVAPIYTLPNIHWTRCEIRKIEFDIEDYEDIKASHGRAGTYKFPIHIWRSKNFDQTNAASSSANALQTTLNAPNIDRIFITQPLTRDYYTFLPTSAATDINPQLHNNPILPRTEDCLNARTCERIFSVFIDTDKYTPPSDLYNSVSLPIPNKHLWLKNGDTYGGTGSVVNLQRGLYTIYSPVFLPNKFAYAVELNEGGCFRRGFNSVIDGRYSATVPVNMQCSVNTSNDIYWDKVATNTAPDTLASNPLFNSTVAYGSVKDSGAVASIHCLCDYICWFNFDPYGNLTDFGSSPYNGQEG